MRRTRSLTASMDSPCLSANFKSCFLRPGRTGTSSTYGFMKVSRTLYPCSFTITTLETFFSPMSGSVCVSSERLSTSESLLINQNSVLELKWLDIYTYFQEPLIVLDVSSRSRYRTACPSSYGIGLKPSFR